MTQLADAERGREIAARWCSLAEQRLEHLTELFESGRWRRYHNEMALLQNIQEAKAAVETWRNLMRGTASPGRSATAVSPGATPSTPPTDRVAPEPTPELEPQRARAPVEGASRIIAFEPGGRAPDDRPSPAPDIDAIQQRYPLLRNAL
ncbi:TIGR03809 family protein [Bradyrhizobium sp.]|uniref:TIGR03809 family protein n=1 Tax=Bradyrhizobium sp. TaxID=376 RepID=UPI0025C3627A|nr:TIGR03809 family protein [Bradyrhizobium sp.]